MNDIPQEELNRWKVFLEENPRIRDAFQQTITNIEESQAITKLANNVIGRSVAEAIDDLRNM